MVEPRPAPVPRWLRRVWAVGAAATRRLTGCPTALMLSSMDLRLASILVEGEELAADVPASAEVLSPTQLPLARFSAIAPAAALAAASAAPSAAAAAASAFTSR